jgi:hypothetical protein
MDLLSNAVHDFRLILIVFSSPINSSLVCRVFVIEFSSVIFLCRHADVVSVTDDIAQIVNAAANNGLITEDDRLTALSYFYAYRQASALIVSHQTPPSYYRSYNCDSSIWL